MKLGFLLKSVLILVLIGGFAYRPFAQTFTMKNGVNTVSCGSTASFYDSGGITGTYSNNENYTYTICPSPSGSAISVDISFFISQNANDKLTIYDGVSTAAQQIVSISGNTSTTGTYTASTNNPSGCLTFLFTSDNAGGATAANSPGWEATLYCSPPAAVPVNADCVTKKTFCGAIAAFTDGNSGAGGVADLTVSNEGCLSGETKPAWYAFTIGVSGNVVFTITPSGATDDIDFGVWGPNPACPPTSAPTRCSAVCPKQAGTACCGGVLGVSCTLAAPTTQTGLNYTDVDVSEAGGASGGNGFCKSLAVLAGETYILMINNASGSNNAFTVDFGGSTAVFAACPTILPINILDFSALVRQGTVFLVWQTASEQNSAYFQVERSNDGVTFKPIESTVKAAGNSSSLRVYNTYDKHPLPGMNYYRLKEVDKDGKAVFSSIEAVKSNAIAAKLLNIYPNPLTKGAFSLDADFICELNTLNVQVSLTNMVGQTVYNNEQIMTQGYNKVSLPISVLDLQSGVYFLQVTSNYQTTSYKVIVE